ncbi:low temperature requirement protein A [Plantactinospora sp. S1510]|uniref:Low temperature requirement protein A n=1 Tax=Plantactinospora alkalitolerans TaxID=2789879 RepID=A0ABS0GU03_9ACTN|nr:low temperature requirement protein A [Plantactinospora alkalitolerans]MBF9129524.1 low temperature requirement protein A [Plantactinospora alkalitolerans]
MTTGRYSTLIRDPDQPQQATYVELFYDLVFVFTLARLAEALVMDLHPLGAYETLLLLLAIWWVWSYTNLATDTLNSRRPAVQLLVIAFMFGSLVMSTAIPDAFGGRAPLFAAAYVGIHLLRSTVLAVILRDHRLRNRPLRGIFWFSISGAIWFAGAFAPAGARVVIWTAALGLDYLGPVLRWPTPRIGRSPAWEWNTAGEHLAERYRQFMIIALGETVVITGRTFRGSDYSMYPSLAFAISFATTVLLWWIYFYRTREKLGSAIVGSADPARETKWAGYAHLIMVAGVVLSTVGDELIIRHPLHDTSGGWVAAIIGGPGLFLAGRALLGHEVFIHVARPWLIGLGVLIVMAPAMVFLPALAVSGTVLVVLLGIVLADVASIRERRG